MPYFESDIFKFWLLKIKNDFNDWISRHNKMGS